jgi:hypothetical protein
LHEACETVFLYDNKAFVRRPLTRLVSIPIRLFSLKLIEGTKFVIEDAKKIVDTGVAMPKRKTSMLENLRYRTIGQEIPSLSILLWQKAH